MKRIMCLVAMCAVFAFTGNVSHAAEFIKGMITVSSPWSRATASGAKVAGGYLEIKNTGDEADKLLSINVDIADKTEIHEMSMDNGVMKMRKIDGIDIPAQSAVVLKPGSFHVMFFGLKAPLQEGETFPATLHFEKAGDIKVDFNIENIGAKAPTAKSAKE